MDQCQEHQMLWEKAYLLADRYLSSAIVKWGPRDPDFIIEKAIDGVKEHIYQHHHLQVATILTS